MSRVKGVTEWARICPECDSDVYYASKYSLAAANLNGSFCSRCANTGTRNGMHGRKGDSNPFYGKKHSTDTVAHLSAVRTELLAKMSPEDRKAQISRARAVVASNPRKSNFEYWEAKYGTEEAIRRQSAFLAKLSYASTGDRNPMYGKPTPDKAGNGWTGWYKGVYFRSARELTFMVENPEAVSAEGKKWRAKYTGHSGQKRTTVPDFVIESEKTVYECKPLRLHNTPTVLAKAEALRVHVGSMGYQYKIVDPGHLPLDILDNLVDTGTVELSEKTKEKLEKWRNK